LVRGSATPGAREFLNPACASDAANGMMMRRHAGWSATRWRRFGAPATACARGNSSVT
jgi:hypothetical protein